MPEYPLSIERPVPCPNAPQPHSAASADQDNMAKVALILEQLTKAVVELRERVAKTESRLSELRPYLDAIKIHVDSLPNALREARRSDLAVGKLIEQLSSRVADLESQLASRFANT